MKKNEKLNDPLSAEEFTEQKEHHNRPQVQNYSQRSSGFPKAEEEKTNRNTNIKLTSPPKTNVKNNQALTNAQMNEVLKKERKNYYGKCLLSAVMFTIAEQYISYVYFVEYRNMRRKNNINYFSFLFDLAFY